MAAVLAFVQANAGVVALVVYAILDLAILLSPGLASNGLVHLLLSWAAGKAGLALPGQTPPAAK